jgi:hypothetical protein
MGTMLFNHFDLPTLIPIGSCILLVVIGLLRVNSRLTNLATKRGRIENFLMNLGSYVKSRGKDQQAYLQMLHQSARIQREMGSYGIAKYKPPGSHDFMEGYQLIVNHLSELERWKHDEDAFFAIAGSMRDGLVLYLGVVDEPEEDLKRKKRNPFKLLLEGIAWILVLPLTLLALLGLLGEDTVESASQVGIVRFFAGFISIVGLLSSVITIITGWSQFVEIVRKWF